MKRLALPVFVLLVAVSAAAAYGAVGSGASSSRGAADLQAQVNALKKQVAALQKDVKALKKADTEIETEALGGIVYGACTASLAADAIQGTWNVVDQIATALQARTYFGAQPPFDDKKTCGVFQVARSTAIPPTVVQLQALVNLLASNSLRSGAAARQFQTLTVR
jgi:hypothetical protein